MTKTRKSVLITGASAGIGAATARLAATKGYNVGIGYHSDKAGAEAVAKAVSDAGTDALLLQGDVSNPEDIARIFAQFDAEFGPLDALVNNAGVVDTTTRVEDMDFARLRRMFDTNTLSVFMAAGEAVRRMANRHGGEGGVIINVSSIAPRLGGGNQYVDYAASKGAVDVLTKGLADEVADQGIRVVGIRPGIIETEIHAKGGQPDRVRALTHMIPVKRPGTADEIAQSILWLMSDEASYVTGTLLDVSGGR